ncbi:MAG: radical SAM protein [Theionarchaea archaeon]|nr:radical SAM protein [Theionarchaea archaeon]
MNVSDKYPVIAQGYGVFMEPDGGYIFTYEESCGIKRTLSPCEDLNLNACAILEQCTGSKTVEEIVNLLKDTIENAPPDLYNQVKSFLDEASRKGYIDYCDTPVQIRGLLQGNTVHYTPSRVLLETTTKCNLKCGHCLLSAGEYHPDELTTEESISILETFSEMGVKRVVLSGGEVLAKKGWKDLVHFCTQRFHTSLFTNGTMIADEADALHCLNEVHISLYGSTAKTHERISEVKGSFDKTVKGMSALTQKGIYVGLSVLMVPFNLHQLEDIVKMAVSLKCSIVRIGVAYPLGRARTKKWELTHPQKEWLRKKMENLQEVYGIEIRWEEEIKRGNKCGAGYSRWAVTSNGDVYPCSVFRLRIGSLKKEDPSTILGSPAVKFLQELEPPHKGLCGDCNYLYVCRECHGHALTHAHHVDACKWIAQFEHAPERLKGTVWKGSSKKRKKD